MISVLASFWAVWFFFVTPPAAEKVQWLSAVEHDFGDIDKNKAVSHTFLFKNSSKAPLLIDNVRTSCGCTGSTWVETPILPDSIGQIIIEYDARDIGYFYKSAKVYFHRQRKAEKLYITGVVLE